MIPAIVLAGRSNRGRLRAWSEAECEALIPLAGRPMLARVLDALAAAPSVGPLLVVAAGDEVARLAAACGARPVAAGASLVASLRAGLAALPAEADTALLVTGDAALLTPQAVEEFLAAGLATGADLCWAVVPRDAYERQLPGSRRTYVRTADGTFTGGNLFLVRRRAVEPALDLLESFYAARKSPLGLARLLGLSILVRLLLGRLSIAAVEGRVLRLAGIRGRAVPLARAELGFDVDDAEDAAYADAVLRRREGGGGAA